MEERFEGHVVADSDCLAVSIAYISASLSAPIFPMSHQDFSSHMQVKVLMDPVDGLLIRGILRL